MAICRVLAWAGGMIALIQCVALPARATCVGDCNGDGAVAINELVTLVDVGLDGGDVARCAAGDVNGDAAITIDELVAAVGSALNGCPATPTPPATATATPFATDTPSTIPSPSATATAPPATNTAAAATPTASPTVQATATETDTAPPTATRTAADSPTPPATATPSPSAVATEVPATASPDATVTATASASVTASEPPPPSATATATTVPPSATPQATHTASGTVTATATASATVARTDFPKPTASSTPTSSRTLTATRSGTPTRTPTATASATRTQTPTASATATRTASVTRTSTPTLTSTPTRTPTRTATATPSATASRTATLPPSATATASPTATATPGLGPRRFSLAPASSTLALLPLPPDQGTFAGFSGYLDLAAGVPDPQTGIARVAVTGASEFLSVDVDGGLTFCIHPLVPVSDAGVLSCSGGIDLGVTTSIDHDVGVVDVDGFTVDDCVAAKGTVEGAADPHPGVCNGPTEVGPSPETDSGAGALLIGEDVRFGTHGLPVEISFAPGACAAHQVRTTTVLGLVTGISRAVIHDANDEPDAVIQIDTEGENFSCAAWPQENGPGRLVLAVPTLHGLGTADLVTVYTFDD